MKPPFAYLEKRKWFEFYLINLSFAEPWTKWKYKKTLKPVPKTSKKLSVRYNFMKTVSKFAPYWTWIPLIRFTVFQHKKSSPSRSSLIDFIGSFCHWFSSSKPLNGYPFDLFADFVVFIANTLVSNVFKNINC